MNWLHGDGLVVLEEPDEITLRTVLQGDGGDDDGVRPLLDNQVDVDELIGKQHLRLVFEDSFQLASAGCRVDLVIGGKQVAGGQ